MENQTINNPENNQSDNKVKPSNSSLNKNVKIALIVIGVLVVLGIAWRVQNYVRYRSYVNQAENLQKQAEEYQKTYLKQMNDLQKKLLEDQKKALNSVSQ